MNFIVLAVEDDLQEQLVISRALSNIEGVKLVLADTGGDALDYIHRRGLHEGRRPNENPTLVLADHNLPDMLAVDLVKGVRSHPTLGETPVFVYGEDVDFHDYDLLDVDGPLRKPLSNDHFRSALHDAVSRHRSQGRS